MRELCRVGKSFFITTPNRWFPFEHHTGLPLLHYLPPSVFRPLLRRTRYRHWAEESNLNILTARELAALFPVARGGRQSVRFGSSDWLPISWHSGEQRVTGAAAETDRFAGPAGES